MENYDVEIMSKRVLKKSKMQEDFIKIKVKCLSGNFKDINKRIQTFNITMNLNKDNVAKGEKFFLQASPELLKKRLVRDSGGFNLTLSKKDEILFIKSEKIGTIAFKNFLKSNIKGVGEKKAQSMLDLGINIIDFVYEYHNDIDMLSETLSMLTKTQIQDLIDSIMEYDAFNQIATILYSLNITKNYQNDIYLAFREDSIKTLKRNPFLLSNILDIDDFFKLVHGLKIKNPELVRSMISYTLHNELAIGNTKIDISKLKEEVQKTSKFFRLNIVNLDNLCQKQLNDSEFTVYDNYIQLRKIANEEKYIAKKFKTLNKVKQLEDIDIKIDDYLNTEQQEAIKNVVNNNVSIITGGAGVGKTTVLKSIIKNTLDDYNVLLFAPTGKASQRMTEAINNSEFTALTLHKRVAMFERGLLKMQKASEEGDLNLEDSLLVNNKRNFYIIDESSMMNQETAYKFLMSIEDDAKILLVGDVKQLSSIGYGNIFKDLINSDIFNISYLITKIRQGNEVNSLSKLIDDIENKEFNLHNYTDETVNFININDYSSKGILTSLYNQLKDKTTQLDGITKQCLAPMNVNSLGNNEINEFITDKITSKSSFSEFNPLIYNFNSFTVFSPVIVTENYKPKDILNGMSGVIKNIFRDSENKDALVMRVQIEGINEDVDFINEEIKLLKPAYSISIHKSQGSEYDEVFLVLPKEASFMLNFNLIYTAITRAKKKVTIIGDENILKASLMTEDMRQTALIEKIK